MKDKKIIRNRQHRFIKDNSCLTSPMAVAFFRKITGNVAKEGSHQWLNVWLADGDKQSSPVVCPSALGFTLFIVLRNGLSGDTQTALSEFTD